MLTKTQILYIWLTTKHLLLTIIQTFMKTSLLKMALCCLIIALMCSCQNAKGEPTADDAIDTDKIKTEIIALESAYADAMNIGNANGAAAYYADDAQSYHVGEALIGKQAIIESLKKELLTIPAGAKVSFITNEVLVSSDGNQVVETGKYTVSNSTNPAVASGNFISVFEKRDGKYVCIRDMAVSDKPKE